MWEPLSNHLELWLQLGGVLHFGILSVALVVPRVLDFRRELAHVGTLLRQLIWVHGGYIVLMIVAFGTLSLVLPGELAAGTLLARCVCGFIAVFWLVRLALALALFDVRPYLVNAWRVAGHVALTATFVYCTVVYAIAALHV